MAYASCVLPQLKQKLSTHEVVCLVMLPVGLEKSRVYLKHAKFYLETVNKASNVVSLPSVPIRHDTKLGSVAVTT